MEQLTKNQAVATSQEAVQNQNEPQLRDENAHNDKSVHGVLNPTYQRSEERFSRNAETDLVCRLLLEKKKAERQRRLAPDRHAHRRRRRRLAFAGFFKLVADPAIAVELVRARRLFPFFFFNDTATTEIYTLSLHDALPISE